MNKHLYTYETEMPTISIFREHVHRQIPMQGGQFRFKQIMEVTQEDLEWCDIMECIRPNDPYTVTLAKRARKLGCFVIAYYDDDLYDLPDGMPNPPWRKKNILNILRNSHMLHSSSRHICNKYQRYTLEKRSCASDTAVDAAEIKQIARMQTEESTGETVKLIYAANPGHVVFFDQFIRPIMPLLCERYGDKISMTFMGIKPDLSEYASKMELIYIPGMALAEYRKKIQEGNYDIGLSPMITTEFTKCKYFNKFIEYTMAGIVGVYSNTEPYTYVVEHNINGFLAEDTPEAWMECLSRAIEDALLRNRCICNAQALLLEEFSPERIIQKQNEDLPELKSFFANKQGTCGNLTSAKFCYRLSRLLDKLYLLWFYFRQQGISGVLNKLRG